MGVLGANRVLQEAHGTYGRPLLAVVCEEMGVPANPIAAFRWAGYAERLTRERSVHSESGEYPGV